jgi:hypothetical protein
MTANEQALTAELAAIPLTDIATTVATLEQLTSILDKHRDTKHRGWSVALQRDFSQSVRGLCEIIELHPEDPQP